MSFQWLLYHLYIIALARPLHVIAMTCLPFIYHCPGSSITCRCNDLFTIYISLPWLVHCMSLQWLVNHLYIIALARPLHVIPMTSLPFIYHRPGSPIACHCNDLFTIYISSPWFVHCMSLQWLVYHLYIIPLVRPLYVIAMTFYDLLKRNYTQLKMSCI